MNKKELKNIEEAILDLEFLVNEIKENRLIELLTESEKLALKIRRFVANNINESEGNKFETSVVDCSEVEISEDANGVISINIPPLLPFKKIKI